MTVAYLNNAAIFNFSTYLFLSQGLFQARERIFSSCTIFTSRLRALLDILFAASLGLFQEVFDFSLISNFSKLFLVFRVFLLIVLYELVTVLTK